MLLVPGTALHHGNYVIDALLEDTDNGALYWGTQIATGSPVYIQVGTKNQAALSGQDLEAIQTLPNRSLPSLAGILDAFAEDHHHYLVMGIAIGLPWSHRQRYQGPLSPKQALLRVQQVATGWLWLTEQGVTAIDLAPNRLWWPDPDAPTVLSGWFGESKSEVQGQEPSTESDAERSNPLPALATLLWQFLCGNTLPAPRTVPEMRQQHPNVSPQILQVIQLGLEAMPPPRTELASTLTQWLQSLPLPDTNAVLMPSQSPLTPSSLTSTSPSTSFQRPGLALTLTAVIAAIGGLGVGAAWRFAPSTQPPGTARFSPEQGFPTLSNWSGDNPEEAIDYWDPQSRDPWRPSPTPQDSGLIEPNYLEGIPDRWASPTEPWQPSSGRTAREEDLLRPYPGTDPLPADGRDFSPQTAPAPDRSTDDAPGENPQPEPTMADPATPTLTPNDSETAPPEVTAPAPTPDLSTAES
ncbi:MAG: hypothetical protein O2890_02740 [Cyanobacteria bacterium]|nr:hypothetical protein [Cyanobacteriota bacterium]MDA0865332.1 hypothetical protein [Cyanobacteriota bacterium]